MHFKKNLIYPFLFLLVAGTSSVVKAQSGFPGGEATGSWDITIQTADGTSPAWLQIKQSGIGAMVGHFVGPAGSARPISKIDYSEGYGIYSFTIPPQWSRSGDVHAEFKLENGKLNGWISGSDANRMKWTASRAPELRPEGEPQWGEPIHLLENGLSAWQIPENSKWSFENGILDNEAKGGHLITKQKFNDFKLHVEFRYPEGSNSGIYLRGRYELQITDSYGMKPESHNIGGIYGFIDPSVNAAKKAGEWQTYDVTLRGRYVTVVLNGKKVICNRPIPGITGEALNSNEGEPGPIYLQGNHGPVQFRNITITPAK